MSSVRATFEAILDRLSEDQTEKLLQVANIFYPEIATSVKTSTETDEDFEYDVTKDPMVGFLSFPDDVDDASNVKEVVRRRIQKKFESLTE